MLLVEQGAWMGSLAHDVALPGRGHHLEGCIHGEAPLRQLRPKLVCDSVGESGESSEPEWVIHYDRTGRPYWSDGVTATWKKPHSYRPV